MVMVVVVVVMMVMMVMVVMVGRACQRICLSRCFQGKTTCQDICLNIIQLFPRENYLPRYLSQYHPVVPMGKLLAKIFVSLSSSCSHGKTTCQDICLTIIQLFPWE